VRATLLTGLMSLASFAAHAQTSEASPRFDVASVKPSPPRSPGRASMMNFRGGPGTRYPGRIDWQNISLANFLAVAYNVRSYQIAGPEWMDSAAFDVAATMSTDATTQEFHLMLQRLLAERFKLTLHHEQRESAAYSLVVGKGGPKMKESAEAQPAPGKMQRDEDGFPVFPGMRDTYTTSNAGRMRIHAIGETMARFAMLLSGQLRRPVTDATGLNGKYDFVVTYAPAGLEASPGGAPAIPDAGAGLDLIGAMRQIGLNLEQKREPIDIIVIDHLEKVPTEN
jgi:uncharacterized protein (TIGR03435 family)